MDRLDYRDVPEPETGPSDVKIRMAGASINPLDWKLRSGALAMRMPLSFPATLGRDASGEVIQIGAKVTHFQVGQRVLGLVMGAYAEVVVADEAAWALMPKGMNLADAGALPLALLTGAELVEEAIDVRAGQIVLVTGALGSVGRAAVFAAKARGARVWVGVRGKRRAEAAMLGASVVVALDDDAEIARLPELDVIADTVGGETTTKLLGRLKRGGILGTVVGAPAGASDHGVVVRPLFAHTDPKRLAELAQAVSAGSFVIPIVKRLPLAKAAEAQTLAEHHAGGKVLLLG